MADAGIHARERIVAQSTTILLDTFDTNDF